MGESWGSKLLILFVRIRVRQCDTRRQIGRSRSITETSASLIPGSDRA